MGKIYYIMGVTCSGKSTLYNDLIKVSDVLNIKPLIETTTRPIRDGEENGVQYNFCTDEEFKNLINNEEIIAYTSFNTNFKENSTVYYGITYNSINDIEEHNYLTIGNIETFIKLREKLNDKVFPIFLHADDNIILSRIINRTYNEKLKFKENHPEYSDVYINNKYRLIYKEQCRRFVDDIDKYCLEIADDLEIPQNHIFNSEENVYFPVMDLIYKDIMKEKDENE